LPILSTYQEVKYTKAKDVERDAYVAVVVEPVQHMHTQTVHKHRHTCTV